MERNNVKIAVLLACHNRKAETLKALDSLFRALNNDSPFILNVYLVDDNSTDGTSEAIELLFPNVKIIKGDGNLFWNRGMCLAWSVAERLDYDYYLWLNDDTFLFDDSINSLLKAAKETENKSIIVGTTISSITQKKTYGGIDNKGELLEPNGRLQKCHYFNGNVVLISKYIYKKVGKLDPIFHHAIGDHDYGLRAKEQLITSYICYEYIGNCEGHDNFAKWCQPEVSFLNRIKLLYKTTCDCNPKQFFIFEKRHFGLFQAIKHFISIHVRVFFPILWSSKEY